MAYIEQSYKSLEIINSVRRGEAKNTISNIIRVTVNQIDLAYRARIRNIGRSLLRRIVLPDLRVIKDHERQLSIIVLFTLKNLL